MTNVIDEIYSGEIYFIEGKKMMDNGTESYNNVYVGKSKIDSPIWANRPAVIISNNDYNKDGSVLVTFLSRSAAQNDWYISFSPSQVDVELNGTPVTALCSHVVDVETDQLGKYRGKVTQEELDCIVKKVYKSERFDDIIGLLYKPKEGQLEK